MTRQPAPQLVVIVDLEDEAIPYALDARVWAAVWAALTPAEQEAAQQVACAAVVDGAPEADRA